ncbi:diguanylate cyclase domain-containing protein [Cupriavidus sp. D39]|uniref:diguanylate cyclase domain-containing protein n=1 Tax=Cupriavidus sp. D39 TaxID=2997877 RepID=UPI00226EAA34|nr:diguanylate cyclase [Cupriavidus sp. D39]MCY0853114.1 diguanylate cyclase [Cupriavidus sp. D39]
MRAVVAGELTLVGKNFVTELARNRIGTTGVYCLVSAGDHPRYVVHPDAARLLAPTKGTDRPCDTDEPLTAWDFIQPRQPIVARYLLRTNGWQLVATLPAKEAFSPLTDTRPKVLLASGIALVGAVILTWIVVRRMLVPLERLHRMVQKSAMDPSVHLLQPTTRAKDEIGELAATFSIVMRQLVHREAALQNAEARARESEERSRAISNRLPGLVSYVDVDERYVFVNEAYEQRFGLPATKIVGLSIRELWGAQVYADEKPYLKMAFAGSLTTFDRDFQEQGEYKCLEVSYQPAWNDAKDTIMGLHIFARDVTVERLRVKFLEKQVLSDHLTGLLNRKGFDRNFSLALAEADTNGHVVALVLVDLDDFKLVNDTYGHTIGDKLLQLFAKRLSSCLQEYDVKARIGGDEFAVILGNVAQPVDAERVANAIVNLASEPYRIDGHSLVSTVSVGLALRRPEDGQAPGKLFLRADTALYSAKHGGKGRHAVSGAV